MLIVRIRKDGCVPCSNLDKIWEDVMKNIKLLNGSVDFLTITVPTRLKYNIGLNELLQPGVPLVFSVDNDFWVKSIEEKTPVDFKGKVNLFNREIHNSKVEIANLYNTNVDGFVNWFKSIKLPKITHKKFVIVKQRYD